MASTRTNAKATKMAARREEAERQLRRVRAVLRVLEIAPAKARTKVLVKLASVLDGACDALRVYDASFAAKHVDGRGGLTALTQQLRAALKG